METSDYLRNKTLTDGVEGRAVVVVLGAFGGVEGRGAAEEASSDFLGALFGELEVGGGGGGGRDAVVGGGWRRHRVGAVGETGGAVVVVLPLEGGWGGDAVGVRRILRFVSHGDWVEEETLMGESKY